MRQCYQTILQHYKNQGVKGIRFQFAFRGGGESTALNSNGTVNTDWSAKVFAFFQDVKTAGINDITITPNFFGWENDGAEFRTVQDGCTGQMRTLRFWPTAPFGTEADGKPWKAGENNSYNCSPANPIFIGWQKIHDAIGEILQRAKDAGLTVVEFETSKTR